MKEDTRQLLISKKTVVSETLMHVSKDLMLRFSIRYGSALVPSPGHPWLKKSSLLEMVMGE
jgi:hypothetical protein